MAERAVDRLASIFGGFTGRAVEATKTRKKRLDEMEEKAQAVAEPVEEVAEEVAEVKPRRRGY